MISIMGVEKLWHESPSAKVLRDGLFISAQGGQQVLLFFTSLSGHRAAVDARSGQRSGFDRLRAPSGGCGSVQPESFSGTPGVQTGPAALARRV